MTKRKIRNLTNLTAADNLDLIPVVDIDEPILELQTKKITVGNLLNGLSGGDVVIPYQTTGAAPTSTPADGALVLDNNGGTITLWVRANGAWVALVSV